MDWTDLVQNRERWRVLVNVIINSGFYILLTVHHVMILGK